MRPRMRPHMRPRMGRGPLAALLLAGTAGGAAFAQDQNPDVGQLFTATISERVTADSNYQLDDPSPGTSYYADTRLLLGYANNTPTQTFALGLDTGLRALWQAEQSFEFVLASPTGARLDYTNEWADGLFDATLRYRQRQVNSILDIGVDTDNNGTIDNLDRLTGDTREMRYDANVGVVWGTSTPSSYGLRLIATRFDYSDETDNRVPRTTVEGQGNWNLRLNPVLSSQVLADVLQYQAQNDTDTELDFAEITAGAIYQPGENLQMSAGVGWAKRKRYDTIAGEQQTTQNNTGPSVRGDFTYTTEDLTFLGNANYTTAAPDPQLSGALRAVYALPSGRLTGRVFQNYTGTDTGGQEAKVTGIGVGWLHNINAVSSFGLDFAWALQVDVDDTLNVPAEPDIHRTNVTATYSHAITNAVSGLVGYRFRQLDEEPDHATSHAVFIEVARTFETYP
jgi:hypothetical protein